MSNSESLNMSGQPQLDEQVPSFPGYLLRQVREDKGWSQKDTAKELHLTSQFINAIEEGDFEVLPGTVFARGYIRSYARHLGLDGQALVAKFDALYGVPDHFTKPMSGIRSLAQQSKPSDTWVKVVSALFVIGLVAVSMMWWQSQNRSLSMSKLTNETLIGQVDDDNEGLDQFRLVAGQAELGRDPLLASDTEVPAELEVTSAVVTEVTQPPFVGQPQAETDIVVQAPVEESTEVVIPVTTNDPNVPLLSINEATLVMVFDKDCWVEVKDSDNNVILSDLFSADDRIDLIVTAPIKVLLGRSSAVTTMTFDGRKINLAAYARQDIARLTLKK